MKTCTTCKEDKPAEEFYSRSAKCKSCYCARVRLRRRTNPAVQAYDRERAKTPKIRSRIAAVVKRWRAANPEKERAQSAVARAIKGGHITRKPCEVCGDPKSHAHHDDYSKPLEVRFLCALHHRRWHADHPEVK
jgi:hypothetical protein